MLLTAGFFLNTVFVWKIKLPVVTIFFSLQVENAGYMKEICMFDVVFLMSL
jgi:hypothetical protein